MLKTYFITSNKNKFIEIAEYIPVIEQLAVKDLPEIQSLNINEIIKHKLLAAVNYVKEKDSIFIVEDTGLYLNALNGFPGPLIKFMLGSINNEGIFKICQTFNEFNAYSISAFGVLNSKTNIISFFQGRVKGLVSKPKGKYGFGWDPVFIPKGSDKTFAEMKTIEEKNKYSMRYIALQKMIVGFPKIIKAKV